MSDDQTPDEETQSTEGVRLIGADEAAEALARDDVARRLGDGDRKPGDRPAAQPYEGPPPSLSFPLSASTSPEEVRRPSLASEDRPRMSTHDRDDDVEDLEASDQSHEQEFVDDEEDRAIDQVDQVESVQVVPEPDGEADEIDYDVSLPHWTEPATGEIPAVLRRDDDPEDGGDDDWAKFTGSVPRWRDSGSDFDDELDDVRMLADHDGPIGALDESDRPSDSDFFSFDEIAEPAQRRSVFAEFDDAQGQMGDETVSAHDEDAFFEDDPYEQLAAAEGEEVFDDAEYDDYDEAEYDDDAEYDDAYYEETVPIGGRRGGRAVAGGIVADGGGRDMGQAIGVGVAFAAVALGLFAIGPVGGLLIVLAVVTVAGVELFTAIRKAGYEPPALVGMVAVPALVLGAYHRGEAAIPAVLFIATVVGMLWYLAGAGGKRPTANLGVTLFGVLWVGMFGSFAALMLAAPDGVGLLIGAIIATVGYDVGGLLVGKNAGKYPLSAASPNKTWEGLIGGMLIAVVAALVFAGFVPGFAPWDSGGAALKLGIVVALAAPLGDLCQSLIKRDLGIKDMGSFLPGHGGLLDRFDSMLFVIPAVYYLARISDFFQ